MLKRPFVGIFVVFLLLGCFSVIREGNMPVTEKQAEGQIEGVVFDIVEKANTTEFHLKNCVFYETEGKKTYHVGNIIVYYSRNSSNSKSSNYYNSNDSNNSNNSQVIEIGNKISLSGTLDSFVTPRNLGQFNEYIYYRSRNYHYKFYGEKLEILDRNKNCLKEGLREFRGRLADVYEIHLQEKEAGIIKAMVLGEKSGMDKEVKELYQHNGIGHLIAISGLHITLVAGGFYKVLERFGSAKKVTSILVIVFIWLYGLMTGFSVSTNRAVVMMILSLVAGIVGRTYDMLTALSISGIVILAQKPMLCMDSGFLLSFGAIIGIGVVNSILMQGLEIQKTREEMLREEKSKRSKSAFCKFKFAIQEMVKKSLMASLSVQIVTLPVILYFYYEISLYGVGLNIIVIPLMSILLGTALVGGIIGILFPFIPFLSRFFMGSVHVILSWYEKLGSVTRELPFSRIIVGKPEIWQVGLYYVWVVCLVYVLYTMNGMCEGREVGQLASKIGGREGRKVWKKAWEKLWNAWIKPSKWQRRIISVIWLVAGLGLLIPVGNFSFARPELEFTFVDVGQGDCIFMRSKNGFTCLVDGGSSDEKNVGTYRIIPFLKAKGIAKLNYVMVTHTDSDHISGVIELLEASGKGGIEIGSLVLPRTMLIDENYERLVNLAEECVVPVVYIKAEDKLLAGKLEITCLHPAADYNAEDSNSYSTVLKVQYGEFKALLTGDLGIEQEKFLVKNKMLEDVLLLKVAHHGSKNSTCEEFLECVQPELAIISAGKDNSYGHPHRDTLERLVKAGSKIMSTTEYGGITVKVEGGKVRVDGYAK